MTCSSINSGRSLSCRDSVGGIKKVRIAEFATMTGYTLSASNVVTGITMSGDSSFYAYELIKDTSSYEEVTTANNENGTVISEGTLTLIFSKAETSTRNQIRAMAQKDMAIIIEYNDGTYWLIGASRGATLATSTNSSGTVLGDRNGYTIVINSREPEQAYEVSSSIIADITA